MNDAVKIEDLNCGSTKHRHHHQNVVVAHETTTAKTQRRFYHTINDEPLSPEASPFLPYDLVVEILLRLPVKSLLRFKCICKSFKTLISDPQFANHHLRHSTLQQLVPFIITKSIINPPTPDKPEGFSKIHEYGVLGSCNGLLCVYNVSQRYVRLFNPSTRFRSKKSPKFVDGFMNNHGFGYDHVNDKYKVLVKLNCFSGRSVTQVYTFGDNSWTTIQNSFPFSHIPWSTSGTFVSGTLNWVAKGGVNCNQYVIISFDLEKETYGEVLLPQQDGDKRRAPVLDVLSKCLCVCLKYNKTQWVMWRMKQYGVAESWTKLMMLPDEKFCQRNSFDHFCNSEKGVVPVKNLDSELVLYDSNEGWFDCPEIWTNLWQQHYLHICHESLVSP